MKMFTSGAAIGLIATSTALTTNVAAWHPRRASGDGPH